MIVFNARSHIAIATGLGLAGLWLAWVPRLVSNSGFAVFAALLTGSIGVSLVTWRNAQATGSMGQLLYETESSPSSGLRASDGGAK